MYLIFNILSIDILCVCSRNIQETYSGNIRINRTIHNSTIKDTHSSYKTNTIKDIQITLQQRTLS